MKIAICNECLGHNYGDDKVGDDFYNCDNCGKGISEYTEGRVFNLSKKGYLPSSTGVACISTLDTNIQQIEEDIYSGLYAGIEYKAKAEIKAMEKFKKDLDQVERRG